jgi:hypothetical protein
MRPQVSGRMKHPRGGKDTDVYEYTFTNVETISSDASGNIPFARMWSSITGNASWAVMANFDLCRLKHVEYEFVPFFGQTTARPLTAAFVVAAGPSCRFYTDPDGAISAPSVAQVLSVDHTKTSVHKPRDFSICQHVRYRATTKDGKVFRQVSGTDQRQNMYAWTDATDLSTTPGQYVGGLIGNMLVTGGCPASVAIMQLRIHQTMEFVGFQL